MTARRLLEWSDREERRRRAARSGLGKLPALAWSLIAAAALSGEMARRIHAGNGAGASQLWIAVAIAAFAVVVFGAPFRMFWRRDSAFLGRMAIDGGALYRLGLIRSVRASVYILIPCAAAAAVFGPMVHWEVAIRHLELAGVAALTVALLGPAVALFAGAMIASDRALQLVESVAGGEVGAPKTTWLGLFPGLAATSVGAVLMASARWVAGDPNTAVGPPVVVLGAMAGVALLGFVVSLSVARNAMTAAVREVAALDTVRLAHIEQTRLSAIERAWSATVPAGGRAVYAKDAKLSRRRYPAPYFLMAVGVVALWIVAGTRPDTMTTWAAALVGGLAVYTILMDRRIGSPPIEHARFLATLAVDPRHAVAATRQATVLRALMTIAIGGVPIVVRAHDPIEMSVIVGAALAATLFGGMRPRR